MVSNGFQWFYNGFTMVLQLVINLQWFKPMLITVVNGLQWLTMVYNGFLPISGLMWFNHSYNGLLMTVDRWLRRVYNGFLMVTNGYKWLNHFCVGFFELFQRHELAKFQVN